MHIKVDKSNLTGKYDDRNLTISQSGKHKYPSKKMFVEFLKQYSDIDGEAHIYDERSVETGEVTINVKIKYKTKNK